MLKSTKRTDLELKQETLKQRLQKYETRVKSAQIECQNAKQEYQQEAVRLFDRSQQREFRQLMKLNNYIKSYIKALQIPSCTNQMKQIASQLATERDLEQDLQTWQKSFIGTSLSAKCITNFEPRQQSYCVDEPSSDDDDDQEDNCTTVVVYEAKPKKH